LLRGSIRVVLLFGSRVSLVVPGRSRVSLAVVGRGGVSLVGVIVSVGLVKRVKISDELVSSIGHVTIVGSGVALVVVSEPILAVVAVVGALTVAALIVAGFIVAALVVLFVAGLIVIALIVLVVLVVAGLIVTALVVLVVAGLIVAALVILVVAWLAVGALVAASTIAVVSVVVGTIADTTIEVELAIGEASSAGARWATKSARADGRWTFGANCWSRWTLLSNSSDELR